MAGSKHERFNLCPRDLTQNLAPHRQQHAKVSTLQHSTGTPCAEVAAAPPCFICLPPPNIYTATTTTAPLPYHDEPVTHRMSSNSPSGGMKVIVRSASNLPSRTQRWKVQSSRATAGRRSCLPLAFASRSMMSLSFRPNLQSGIPVGLVVVEVMSLLLFLSSLLLVVVLCLCKGY